MEDAPLLPGVCRPSFALDEAAPAPAKRRGSLFGVCLMPAVVALAWFPKAARLVSSSADLSVKVWDARSGACELDLRGHTDIPLAMAARFPDDGDAAVLSVGDDTTGKLFLIPK